MAGQPHSKKRWAFLAVLLSASALATGIGVELLWPDDCASKYRRVKVGMTQAEVHAVMARRNVLLPLVTGPQRLRRAAGLTSVWTEEWYEGHDKLTGVHFRWDGEGRLMAKAIWVGGEWSPFMQ